MKKMLASFILLLCTVTVSHADLFDGNVVKFSYLFPNQGTIYQDLGSQTVGAGVEFTNLEFFNLDITDFQVNAIFGKYGDATWSDAAFNGFVISDVNNTISDFTSVSINQATNMSGLTADRISFDDNNIWVNWQGLSFDNSTLVTLDVNSGTNPVPEPSTFILLGAGLAGLAYSRKRFAKK